MIPLCDSIIEVKFSSGWVRARVITSHDIPFTVVPVDAHCFPDNRKSLYLHHTDINIYWRMLKGQVTFDADKIKLSDVPEMAALAVRYSSLTEILNSFGPLCPDLMDISFRTKSDLPLQHIEVQQIVLYSFIDDERKKIVRRLAELGVVVD